VTATKQIELKDLTPETIRESDLPRLPHMTGWFEPVLLLKLLLRVIVSDVFGQYADRRLMEAALDPATKDDHVARARIGDFEKDTDGAIWIDFVSDLGDGFDATYAIACLLAQSRIAIGEHRLSRGAVLVMGGDEVYPTSLRDDYKIKMRLPYDLAWPVRKGEEKTPLFALPGNHDWYDGLANFLAIFCREKPTKIGGWTTPQRRSYFAVEVAPNWWVWGIDIALVRDMDQPQADYFVAIAQAMPERANLILCSAEPGWYQAEAKGDSYRTLSYAAQIAINAKKDIKIPLVLSGDSHHYARYFGDGTHYITSGGGGAFLHGTLELRPEITAEWLRLPRENLKLEACYPTKEESTRLLRGDLKFGRLNRTLTWALSAMYLAASFVLTYAWRLDVSIATYFILLAGFGGYLLYQEESWRKIAIPSVLHSAAHMAVIGGVSWLALWTNRALASGYDWHWFAWLLVLAVPIAIVGPWLSGKIFGVSLMLACRYGNIGHNDAFSAMRLDSHRHFLRLRIKGDEVTVFPIKLSAVPVRNQWHIDAQRPPGSSTSVFSPSPPLTPELIEDPIVIKVREAASTSDVKTPGEIPTKEIRG
jgi:hypothetical protein